MSYTSKFTGEEIDNLLDSIDLNSIGNACSNPIGAIIPIIGTTAPKDYLVCDGSELNINEYKKLADYFEIQFGSKNHFGGDGVNTFAIPDLRNEFLRGYGELSSEIGKHQEATEIPSIWAWYNTDTSKKHIAINTKTADHTYAVNHDEVNFNTDSLGNLKRNYINLGPLEGQVGTEVGIVSEEHDARTAYSFSTRPTNVAVLFCIKYTENGNSNGGSASENYSTEEQRIGTWTDGKPLYRKVYKFDITATPTRQTIIFAKDFGIDKRYTKIDGNVFGKIGDWKGHYKLGLFDWHNDTNQFFMFLPNMENNDLVLSTQWSVTQSFTVEAIVEYTKITD